MLRFLTKPKCVIVSHVALLLFLWSLGGFVLSDGWLRIDSSAYRDFLYTLFIKVIPIVLIVSVVHITGSIAKASIWIPSFFVALLLGISGPVLLHLSITASDDPVAVMGYLSLIQSYCVCFLITFLISCILFSRFWRHTERSAANRTAH